MKEKQILEKLRKRDRESFNALIEKYSQNIYFLSLKILENEQDAEDVLQETFFTVIKKIDQFKGDSSLYTWIYKIAVNIALGKIRKDSKISSNLSLSDPDFEMIHKKKIQSWPELDPKIISSKEFHDIINSAVQSLPQIYRIVFILRDLQGLSTEETANILDISVSNVKIRLMRARNFLREKLDPRMREYEII